MFSKKYLTNDEKFDEFISTDFSKESLNNFMVSDIANKKNKQASKKFWKGDDNDDDDNDSSGSIKIGIGKSFLKSSKNIATSINVEKSDENIPEIVVKSDDYNDSQISELRLNLHNSSDKSQASNNEHFQNNSQFAHPMTFEGVTENMFDRSYSPTMEGDSKMKIHKLPKGIETIKSNISTIPIDKSHDNFNQSLDKTDKEHLLSKVSLLDSYDGVKVDKSIIKPDDLNSTGGFGFDNNNQDKSSDYDYKNSFNPASGDNFNNTQAITNVTDTVIGDTTAADLAAINKHYEKYNKDSLDFNPLSETIKEIYEDKTNNFDDISKINLESTANSKSFGLKVIRPDYEESHISPVPTPRKRNKNKISKSDNTELETIKDDSVTYNSDKKSETNDIVRPSRFSHVKSSGYGSKSITPLNKTTVQKSSKSQPISVRKKLNQQILNPSNKLNNQTYTKSDQQTKSKDQNRSKSVPKYHENDHHNKSQIKNETYFISQNNTDDKMNIFHQHSHDSFNQNNNEWQEKWLEERKIVKKLNADSVIQERDFKRQIESITQKYEDKIFQLVSQLNRTQQKLEMKADFTNKTLGPDVKKEDIIRIEREMKEQNSILSAYEKDNEKLCQEIKILKQQKKGEDKIDSVENERLISQIVSLKAELDSKEVELKNIKQINKENLFSKNFGYVEGKEFYLEKITDLKNELQILNHRYLQSESDKQKSEMKLDRICTENEKAISRYKNELEIEKTEREKLKEAHKIEVDDLKRKIKWYLENQSILDQNEKKLKMKDNQLAELKQQLNSVSTIKISSNIRAKERLMESEKIKRLEDEIMSLKTDLYSLAKGKNIGNVAEKRTIQFLEEKLRSLESDKDMNSKNENSALRSLQQQFEAMKFQYEEKIRDLEFDLSKKIDNKSHPEKLMRLSDLRSKIDELNSELEKKSSIINKLKAEIRKYDKNINDQIQNENKAKNIRKIEMNNRMEMLEKMLKEKENEIQRLTMHNTYLKHNEERECNNNLSPSHLELQAENARYKSQIIHSSREIDKYRQMVDEIKLSTFKNEELIREECRQEIRKCEEFHKENLNNVKMDFANRHSDSEIASLQSQIEVQKTYINHLQNQTADYNIKLMGNEAKSNELIEAKQQIQNLKTELADLRLIWSKKPGLEMIDRLRTKIVQLEEKENFKGRQLDEYVEKMVRNHSKQYQDEVERWRSIVVKKNQNLIRVQRELDHLLEALEELRRQGIVIPRFSIKSRSLNE